MRLLRVLTLFFVWVAVVSSPSLSHGAEPAEMHYSKPEQRKAIVAVVDAQLAAFRANDFEQAYSLAALGFRRQFTPQQFVAMIIRGYPVIAKNERAEFGLPMDDGVNATLVVEVFSTNARSVSYRYALINEAGVWRIAGVLESKARSSDA